MKIYKEREFREFIVVYDIDRYTVTTGIKIDSNATSISDAIMETLIENSKEYNGKNIKLKNLWEV